MYIGANIYGCVMLRNLEHSFQSNTTVGVVEKTFPIFVSELIESDIWRTGIQRDYFQTQAGMHLSLC